MDIANVFLYFLLSLVVTAFAYLIVPIIIAKSDKKYSKKTLWKIIIINAACVFTFFFILRIALAGEIYLNPSPALLWSGIGFYILKRTSDIDSDYDDEGTLIRCKSCGYIGSYVHECPQCGRYEKEYVEQKDVQIKPNGLYCKTCGKELRENDDFCDECGTRVLRKDNKVL